MNCLTSAGRAAPRRPCAGWLRGPDRYRVSAASLGQAWVPFREVVYRWRRTEEGRMAYTLWPTSGIDPQKTSTRRASLARSGGSASAKQPSDLWVVRVRIEELQGGSTPYPWHRGFTFPVPSHPSVRGPECWAVSQIGRSIARTRARLAAAESVSRRGAGRLAKPTMCRAGVPNGQPRHVRRSLVPCLTRGAGSDLCTSTPSQRARKK
jgi:hypothetical protein